jgi:hypothetical protein
MPIPAHQVQNVLRNFAQTLCARHAPPRSPSGPVRGKRRAVIEKVAADILLRITSRCQVPGADMPRPSRPPTSPESPSGIASDDNRGGAFVFNVLGQRRSKQTHVFPHDEIHDWFMKESDQGLPSTPGARRPPHAEKSDT